MIAPRLAASERRALRPPLALVEQERLDDLVADGVDRAERGHRLLGDQRDLGAPDRAHLRAAGVEPRQVDHVPLGAPGDGRRRKSMRPDDDPARRVDELEDRAHRHALAAAALADDPHDLAGEHVERHAVHRAHHALVQEERDAEVSDSRAAVRRPQRP